MHSLNSWFDDGKSGKCYFWDVLSVSKFVVSYKACLDPNNPHRLNHVSSCIPWVLIILRTYPPRFALRIGKYFNRFVSTKQALDEIPSDTPSSAKEVLMKLTWCQDAWHDAGLPHLFCYLRGAKSLELGDWRQFLPSRIPTPDEP